VWVLDTECLEILNPYLFKILSIADIRSVGNCYAVKPYICEKAAILPGTRESYSYLSKKIVI